MEKIVNKFDSLIRLQSKVFLYFKIMTTEQLKWYQYITVEPSMFLYMFAFQLTYVIEQAFFVRKACIVNHNYTADICDNISNYIDIKKEVQVSEEHLFYFFVLK